jgi:hypothetical protein
MNRFIATISDSANPSAEIEREANDAGQLLRRIQDSIVGAYDTDMQSAKNLSVRITDSRNNTPMIVAAPNAEKLIQEVDDAIRNTYRDELPPKGNGWRADFRILASHHNRFGQRRVDAIPSGYTADSAREPSGWIDLKTIAMCRPAGVMIAAKPPGR